MQGHLAPMAESLCGNTQGSGFPRATVSAHELTGETYHATASTSETTSPQRTEILKSDVPEYNARNTYRLKEGGKREQAQDKNGLGGTDKNETASRNDKCSS